MVFLVVITASIVNITAAETSAGDDVAKQAQAAALDHQPELHMKAAAAGLKAATKLYNDGQVDDAKSMLNDIVAHAEKAADAATKSRKRVKNTEIDLRKMSEKLRDLKRTLSFEDQAPVQVAIDRLEELRTNLLGLMFGKGKK